MRWGEGGGWPAVRHTHVQAAAGHLEAAPSPSPPPRRLTDGVKLRHGHLLGVEAVDDALHLHRLNVEEGKGGGAAGAAQGRDVTPGGSVAIPRLGHRQAAAAPLCRSGSAPCRSRRTARGWPTAGAHAGTGGLARPSKCSSLWVGGWVWCVCVGGGWGWWWWWWCVCVWGGGGGGGSIPVGVSAAAWRGHALGRWKHALGSGRHRRGGSWGQACTGRQPPLRLCTWDGIQILLHPLLEGVRPLQHHITLGQRGVRGSGMVWWQRRWCRGWVVRREAAATAAAACTAGPWRLPGRAGGGRAAQAPPRSAAAAGRAAPALPPHRCNFIQVARQWVHHHCGYLVHPRIRLAAAQGHIWAQMCGREVRCGWGQAALPSASRGGPAACAAPVQQAGVASHGAGGTQLLLALRLDLLVPEIGLREGGGGGGEDGRRQRGGRQRMMRASERPSEIGACACRPAALSLPPVGMRTTRDCHSV